MGIGFFDRTLTRDMLAKGYAFLGVEHFLNHLLSGGLLIPRMLL